MKPLPRARAADVVAPAAQARTQVLQQRHLLALVAIADAGSVHRAAQGLGMPQPALSRQLAEAERLLGCRLFDRNSHGTRPTAAGAAVLPRCRLMLRMLDGMLDIGRKRRPQIVLGCIPRAMHTLMPPMLGHWEPLAEEAAASQQWMLRVIEADSVSLWEQLTQGKVDFAVLREPPRVQGGWPDLLVERLYDDPTVVVCSASHPAITSRDIPLERLLQLGWALPQHGRTSRASLERLLADLGLSRIEPVIEARSFESLMAIVASTRLLSIAPAVVAHRYVEWGMLRVVPVEPPLPPIPVSIACQRSLLEDPWMATFWNELRHAGAHAATRVMPPAAPAEGSAGAGRRARAAPRQAPAGSTKLNP